MARLRSKESITGMSHRSWLRLPITKVIWRRKSRCRLNGSKPRTRPCPPEGCRRPESILRLVVLPAPFGPKKPTISPGGDRKADLLNRLDLARLALHEALECRSQAAFAHGDRIGLAQFADINGGHGQGLRFSELEGIRR